MDLEAIKRQNYAVQGCQDGIRWAEETIGPDAKLEEMWNMCNHVHYLVWLIGGMNNIDVTDIVITCTPMIKPEPSQTQIDYCDLCAEEPDLYKKAVIASSLFKDIIDEDICDYIRTQFDVNEFSS